MEAEPLTAACELAFAVARDGEKAVPPIEPPAAMRNYLYVAQLPKRAMSVAQRAIDEDSSFRRRVAADATEQGVGRAGFLWLTRPPGWDSEVTSPSVTPGPAAPSSPAVAPVVGTIPPAPDVPVGGEHRVSAPPLPTATPAVVQPTSDSPFTPRSSIEDELANLRGLVDELSAERETIGLGEDPKVSAESPVEIAEAQAEPSLDPVTVAPIVQPAPVQPAPVQTESAIAQAKELEAASIRINELQAELSAARQTIGHHEAAELAAAEASEAAAISARESALAATRAAVDAAELAAAEAVEAAVVTARETAQADIRAAVEAAELAAAESAEVTAVTAREALDEVKAENLRLTEERDELASQVMELDHANSLVTGAAIERDHLQETLTSITVERDELAGQLEVAEQAREDLEGELGQVSARWQDLQVEMENARTRMGGVREVFETSVKSMDDEMRKVEGALDGSSSSQMSFDVTEAEVTEAEVDEAEVTEADQAGETIIVDPQSWMSDDEPFPEASDEPALEEAEDPSPQVESSELTSMLDSYGLGSNSSSETTETTVVEEDSVDRSAKDIAVAQDANVAEESVSEQSEADAPVVEVPGTGVLGPRLQIEIPEAIAGDMLATIRHIVATDDVVILVDGDAVAEMGWPETAVATRREALVKYLGDLAADTGAAQDAVFSGSLSDDDDLPVSRAVRVRITTPGVKPADALAELVGSYPREWPVAVVSDDPELMKHAQEEGATVLTNGQLLDLLFDRWEASQKDSD